MTPDEARRLLDGTTPGPWFFDDGMDGTIYTVGPIVPTGTELECTTDDAALATHAPDMATMIAGMRTEYAIAYLDRDGNIDMLDEGYETLAAAQRRRAQLLEKVRPHTRIMRRPVGEWEEA